jgi:hypothetical protein
VSVSSEAEALQLLADLFRPALQLARPSPFTFSQRVIETFGEKAVAIIVNANEPDDMAAAIVRTAPELAPIEEFIAEVADMLDAAYAQDEQPQESAP